MTRPRSAAKGGAAPAGRAAATDGAVPATPAGSAGSAAPAAPAGRAAAGPAAPTRSAAAGPRDVPGALRIVPLDAMRWPALVGLFDRPGDPRWCWCAYWRRPGTSWASHDAAENRDALRALADGPVAPGLLAMRDEAAVGWVAVAPRSEYVRLERSRTIPRLPGEGVWAVTCFVVAKEARRSGVAAALLDAAVDFAREHGATVLEAYPVDGGGRRMPAALAYTGTVGMFERAGFAIAAETTSRPHPGMRRVVVRKSL